MNKIYSPRCKKHPKNRNPKISSTSNYRTMFSTYSVSFKSKRNRFTEQQEEEEKKIVAIVMYSLEHWGYY